MATQDTNQLPDGAAGPDGDPDGFKLSFEPATAKKFLFKAFWQCKLIHCHTFNPASAAARKDFSKEIAQKAKLQGITISSAVIENELMHVIETVDAIAEGTAADDTVPAYFLVEDPEDAEASGVFRNTAKGPIRLANFTARIVEDITVVDDLASSRTFVGSTWLNGQRGEFRLSSGEFGSNEKLKDAIYTAVGPEAKFIHVTIDEVRTAISDVSQDVAKKQFTTAHGWNKVGDAWIYLTTNGHVNADGFHKSTDNDPLRLDLSGDDVAGRLCLKRLKPEYLAKVRQHVVHDFLKLHDRRIMYAILGVVALAALLPFAGPTQRFVLWLAGITGAGKTFAMKLASSFFGDYDSSPGANMCANWSWTANRIEKCGYHHRDALFLVDDFKPELSNINGAVRVVQNYADGGGRGRLHADTRSALVWPIKGLLAATGEDLIQHHPSAVARTIVVSAPNRPKDLERGQRCLENRYLYRGLMADFLRHLIHEGRLETFASAVEIQRQYFYEGIAGRQNDARIAGNFGLLAAALYEFGAYVGPDWPNWETDIDSFIHGDLVSIRDALLGHAESQQPSQIFLDTLRELLGAKSVRVSEWSDQGNKDPRHTVGRLFNSQKYVAISIVGAMSAIQQSLRSQGRTELAISEPALLDQLCQGKVLLDDGLKLMTTQHKGSKTFRRYIVSNGAQVRVALFPAAVLLPDV